MSHRLERELRRRARFDSLCLDFDRSRRDPEIFWNLLQRIASSDTRVWAVAKAATGKALEEAELAMVAQAAAPQLVRMTPGTSRLSIANKDLERNHKLSPVSGG